MAIRKLIEEDSAVSFKVFFSVVGLLVSLTTISTGYFFSQTEKLEAKVEQARRECEDKTLQVNKHFDEHVTELNRNTESINLRLAEIQTDIVWIRRAMNNEIQTGKPIRRQFDK